MVRYLRVHLTLICTGLTGLILFFSLTLSLSVAEANQDLLNRATFQARLETIASRLRSDDVINDAWLSRLETSEQVIIHLENNGSPLFFSGAWHPPSDRDALLREARDLALQQGLNAGLPPSDLTGMTVADFALQGVEGDRYRGAVALIPADSHWFSLTLLEDLSLQETARVRQRQMYLGILALGVAGLGCLSWFLMGLATGPVEAGIRRQNDFVAAASHELRSPFAVLSANASALRLESSDRESLISGMEQECLRVGRLIDDLLLLANSDTATWTVRREKMDLDRLLIETGEQYSHVAEQAGFRLRLELPEDLMPPVLGDYQRLKQVVLILLDNAVHHSGHSGELLLEGKVRRGQVWISVVDHGAGIPDDGKELVFQRFYRGSRDRGDKRNYGLGLSVARELVRLHGGKLRLTDTPGGGCTFTIELPVQREKQSG